MRKVLGQSPARELLDEKFGKFSYDVVNRTGAWRNKNEKEKSGSGFLTRRGALQ